MNDQKRKKLTEFLGECWHEYPTKDSLPNGKKSLWDTCLKCKYHNHLSEHSLRTFTTEQDMIALYRGLHEKKMYWPRFHDYAADKWSDINCPSESWDCFTAWLFCLSGDGYEDRCEMVADFLEG